MSVDVVYKMGHGSKHADSELRYSLRSLSKFKDLGKVFIVGHKPHWVQNVIHIPAQDCYTKNKDANLINKVLLASIHQYISDQFLNMSDDQLFVGECSLQMLSTPFYDNGLIKNTPDVRVSKWHNRLNLTLSALKDRGLPVNCYESHIPCLINKYNYADVVLRYPYGEGIGMCGNTLYYNTICASGTQIPSDWAFKTQSKINSVENLEASCNGKVFFNYADEAEGNLLFLYLQKVFPSKSIYESD